MRSLFSRAQSTAADTSAALRATTAYMLAAGDQASNHPETCVPAGWSPRKNGLGAFPSTSAHVTPFGSLAQAANSGCTLMRLPPTSFFRLSHSAVLGHAGSEGRTRDLKREAPPGFEAASATAFAVVP